jgi:hypothetical protein
MGFYTRKPSNFHLPLVVSLYQTTEKEGYTNLSTINYVSVAAVGGDKHSRNSDLLEKPY